MPSRSRHVRRLPELPARYDNLISLIDNGTPDDPTWPYKPHEWDGIRNALPNSPSVADLEPLLIAARDFAVRQRVSEHRKTPDPEDEIRRLDAALGEAMSAFMDMSAAARLKVAGPIRGLPYAEMMKLFRMIDAFRIALPREHEPDGPPLGASHTRLQLKLIREADRTFDRLCGGPHGRPAFIAAVTKPLMGIITEKTLQSRLTEARKLFP